MRIEDAKSAEWVVIVPDEFEPTVRYFVSEEKAAAVYEEYKGIRNEVVMARIVRQTS